MMTQEILFTPITHLLPTSNSANQLICNDSCSTQQNNESYSFPHDTSNLWDTAPLDNPIQFGINQYHDLSIICLERCIRLAHRHAIQNKKNKFSGFLLGSSSIDADERGITLNLDRFDPGTSRSNGIKCPSAPLPGDVVIPVRLTFGLPDAQDVVKVFEVEDYKTALKILHHQVSGQMPLDSGCLFPIRLHCYYNSFTDDCIELQLHWVAPCIVNSVTATPIKQIPILPTALAKNLAGPLNISQIQSSFKSGYVTMNQARKLLLMLDSDPKIRTLPTLGVWISGVMAVHSPIVWRVCLRYLHTTSLFKRVSSSSDEFILVLYSISSATPMFFQCKSDDNSKLSFDLLSSQESIQIFSNSNTQEEEKSLEYRLCLLDKKPRSLLRDHEGFHEALDTMSFKAPRNKNFENGDVKNDDKENLINERGRSQFKCPQSILKSSHSVERSRSRGRSGVSFSPSISSDQSLSSKHTTPSATNLSTNSQQEMTPAPLPFPSPHPSNSPHTPVTIQPSVPELSILFDDAYPAVQDTTVGHLQSVGGSNARSPLQPLSSKNKNNSQHKTLKSYNHLMNSGTQISTKTLVPQKAVQIKPARGHFQNRTLHHRSRSVPNESQLMVTPIPYSQSTNNVYFQYPSPPIPNYYQVNGGPNSIALPPSTVPISPMYNSNGQQTLPHSPAYNQSNYIGRNLKNNNLPSPHLHNGKMIGSQNGVSPISYNLSYQNQSGVNKLQNMPQPGPNNPNIFIPQHLQATATSNVPATQNIKTSFQDGSTPVQQTQTMAMNQQNTLFEKSSKHNPNNAELIQSTRNNIENFKEVEINVKPSSKSTKNTESCQNTTVQNQTSTGSKTEQDNISNTIESKPTWVKDLPPEAYDLLMQQNAQLRHLQMQITKLLAMQDKKEDRHIEASVVTMNASVSSMNTTVSRDSGTDCCSAEIDEELNKKACDGNIRSMGVNTGLSLCVSSTTTDTSIQSVPASVCSGTPQKLEDAVVTSSTPAVPPLVPELLNSGRGESESTDRNLNSTSLHLNASTLDKIATANMEIENDGQSFTSSLKAVDLPALDTSTEQSEQACNTPAKGCPMWNEESPVLGESASMCQPASRPQNGENEQYFGNLLTQVREMLKNADIDGTASQASSTKSSKSENSNGRKKKLKNRKEDLVVQATKRQLKKMGVDYRSLKKDSDSEEFTFAMPKPLIPQINYTALESKGASSTELSMHANAIALKYLPDDKLTEIAKLSESTRSSRSSRHTEDNFVQMNNNSTMLPGMSLVSPCNMSIATRKYMEKYGLIEKEGTSESDDSSSSNEESEPLHNKIKQVSSRSYNDNSSYHKKMVPERDVPENEHGFSNLEQNLGETVDMIQPFLDDLDRHRQQTPTSGRASSRSSQRTRSPHSQNGGSYVTVEQVLSPRVLQALVHDQSNGEQSQRPNSRASSKQSYRKLSTPRDSNDVDNPTFDVLSPRLMKVVKGGGKLKPIPVLEEIEDAEEENEHVLMESWPQDAFRRRAVSADRFSHLKQPNHDQHKRRLSSSPRLFDTEKHTDGVDKHFIYQNGNIDNQEYNKSTPYYKTAHDKRDATKCSHKKSDLKFLQHLQQAEDNKIQEESEEENFLDMEKINNLPKLS